MGIPFKIFFEVDLFLFDLLLHLMNFFLQILVRLLLGLSFSLVEDSFLDDDSHNFFIVEIFFGEFESVK